MRLHGKSFFLRSDGNDWAENFEPNCVMQFWKHDLFLNTANTAAPNIRSAAIIGNPSRIIVSRERAEPISGCSFSAAVDALAIITKCAVGAMYPALLVHRILVNPKVHMGAPSPRSTTLERIS